MKINEGYNLAVKKYSKEIADKISNAGIPKNFIDAAYRFYVEDGVPIHILQDDFKKWNRYIIHNPSIPNGGEKNIQQYKTHSDFERALRKAMQPFLCPNPIYDDGTISIGECKNQRDARWFPIQNLAFPDDNNDFCLSKKIGGYKEFQKFINQGYKVLLLYDKSRDVNDPYKRMAILAKDGYLSFWNNQDVPCGTTKKPNDPIWNYIDTLPHEAQIALSEFAESTQLPKNNNKTNENKTMKKNVIRINEAQLKEIVAESVKQCLTELDWKTYQNARRKSQERGEYDRALRFGNASDKAFNDKFAYQGDEESPYFEPNVRGDTFSNKVIAHSERHGFDSQSHTLYHQRNKDGIPYDYDSTKAFGIMDKYDKEGRYRRMKNPSLKRFFGNAEQEDAYRRASKEMDDYIDGNYEYVKGDGWKIKGN
jgi:hypothetical protein